MVSSLTRKLPTVIGAMLLVATLFTAYTATQATASHEPANKAGASGSDLEAIDGDGTVLLSETMRVSSPEDAIISVSAECAILTAVNTNNSQLDSRAFGSVRLWIEVDGKRVPVATDDDAATQDPDDENSDATDESDEGEVTFCNRAHQRTVSNGENDNGVDNERDYLATRAANAFNWVAFDLGTEYDRDGDNVITVELWADYDAVTSATPAGGVANLAQAYVGSRTMIIEPTKVSNHEQVSPDGTEESN